MRKKIVRNLAIINCLLLTLPGLALAAETNAEAVDDYVLDEVIVSAVPLDKYLVTTSVITDKDIEEKGAKNLSEALEDVPGVNLHRGKKNTNTLDIRGSALSYTKIYIDGVLVNPLGKVSGGDSVDLDMFPVDNIAKIEVIKGPAPVAYGTDAIGGIIVITTKSGKTHEGGKVSLSGGSDNTRNASVSYGGGDEKFNYYINAGTEHTDGHTDNNADRKSNYFNTKMNWKLKDNASLTFAGGYSITDKGCLNPVDPATGEPMWYTMGFWRGLNNWEIRDWVKTDLSLTYTEKANSKLDYTLKIYRFTEDNEIWAYGPDHYTGTNPVINPSGYSTARWNASYWDSTLKGVELQSNWKLNASHTLSFGTLYNDTDWKKSDSDDNSNPYDYYWENYENKRYGYYLQDNYLPNDRTTITFGIRHDKNEVIDADNDRNNEDSATNPSINVVYQVDNYNTVRASYGETISFPTVSQIYGSTAATTNLNLKPEKAKNYEVGWKHQFDASLTGDFAIFKNDIDDMIDRVDKNHAYFNANYAEIYGAEIQLDKKFTNQCDGFLSYAYLDTTAEKVNGTTSDMKYAPTHNINYGITYKADKGYKFRLTGHIVTERATWDDGSGDTVTEVTPTLPSYHVMDLQIKRQMNETQDWYINIYNIFDKDYQDELYYPAAGVTVLAGLDFKF